MMLCYAFVHLVERLWAASRIDPGSRFEMFVLVNVKCARWLPQTRSVGKLTFNFRICGPWVMLML